MDSNTASAITQLVSDVVSDVYRIQRQLAALETVLETTNPALFQKYRERLDSLNRTGGHDMRLTVAIERLQAFLEK